MPLLIKRAVHIAHFDFKMVCREALFLNADLSQLYDDILEMQSLFRQIHWQ